MKFSVLNRKVHYWLALVIALPALIMFCTGLLLQLKKQVAWVQPPEQRGMGTEPSISLPRILELCRTVPEAGVQSWSDISRLDIRPKRGMVKVTSLSNYEVQIDSQTGAVLQVAYRRSDLIEALHDGSWFHDGVKYWLFLPAGIILLILWGTGLYLFWLPIGVKMRKKRKGYAGVSEVLK